MPKPHFMKRIPVLVILSLLAVFASAQQKKTDNLVKILKSLPGDEVTHNGTGIPDSIKDKIMQPFFTTKPTGEGTGLGLSLSYDIVVKGHGGNMDMESTNGEGSEFIVLLPV